MSAEMAILNIPKHPQLLPTFSHINRCYIYLGQKAACERVMAFRAQQKHGFELESILLLLTT